MEKNVKFLFKTTELEIRWRSTCISVQNQFDLPTSRLSCFIDDVNSPWFVDTCGGTKRAAFTLWSGQRYSYTARSSRSSRSSSALCSGPQLLTCHSLSWLERSDDASRVFHS